MDFELPYDAFLRVIKENTDVNHCFLLGAGASITSNVQSAADCIWEWKRNIFITKNPGLSKQYSSYKSESIQKSIQKSLDAEGIYPPENDPTEYSFFAEAAFPIEETRRKYFENICKAKEPYVGYKILSELAKKGMIKSVFTTNFDGLVDKAAYQSGLTPIPISLTNANYIHRVIGNNELLSVSLHGDFKFGPLKNTSNELDTQHVAFVSALKKHLYDKHLVVIGYSGRDISLMNALKEAYSDVGAGMLFWCGYGNEATNSVKELLNHLKENDRKGFFVSTDGFDTTMIDIGKTCYENDEKFYNNIDKLLQGAEKSIWKSPFRLDISETNILLRSNLLPISLPREVFQVNANFPTERVWATIKELIGTRELAAVPLKGCLYCFGTQSEIREAFSTIITGEIKRTPVTYQEIKEGTAFKSLYLTTIVKAISNLLGFESDGKRRMWGSTYSSVTKENVVYKVFDAMEFSLIFDKNYRLANPFAYLCINPTFQIISDVKIEKSIRWVIGKGYHEKLLSGKPNVKFNDQLQKVIKIMFPKGNRMQFEFPVNGSMGFKFLISPDTMYVSLMKNTYPKRKLSLPPTFPLKKIIHTGIQYAEPRLEFINKSNEEIIYDFHPMRGLRDNHPYDYLLNGNVFDPEINLAVICPEENSRGLYSFLNGLNTRVEAGRNNPDYLIDYPGFAQSYGIPLNIPDTTSENWKGCVPSHGPTILQTAILLADSLKRIIDQFESARKKWLLSFLSLHIGVVLLM